MPLRSFRAYELQFPAWIRISYWTTPVALSRRTFSLIEHSLLGSETVAVDASFLLAVDANVLALGSFLNVGLSRVALGFRLHSSRGPLSVSFLSGPGKRGVQALEAGYCCIQCCRNRVQLPTHVFWQQLPSDFHPRTTQLKTGVLDSLWLGVTVPGCTHSAT